MVLICLSGIHFHTEFPHHHIASLVIRSIALQHMASPVIHTETLQSIAPHIIRVDTVTEFLHLRCTATIHRTTVPKHQEAATAISPSKTPSQTHPSVNPFTQIRTQFSSCPNNSCASFTRSHVSYVCVNIFYAARIAATSGCG